MARELTGIPVWSVQLETGQASQDGFILTASVRFQAARYVGRGQGVVTWGLKRATIELVPGGCEVIANSISSSFQNWSPGTARRGVVIRATDEDSMTFGASAGIKFLNPIASIIGDDKHKAADSTEIEASFVHDSNGTSCTLVAADPHPVFEVEAAMIGSNDEIPFNARVILGLIIGTVDGQGPQFLADAKFSDDEVTATVTPSLCFSARDVILDRARFTGPFAEVGDAMKNGLERMKEAVVEALIKQSVLPSHDLGLIVIDGNVLRVPRKIEVSHAPG